MQKKAGVKPGKSSTKGWHCRRKPSALAAAGAIRIEAGMWLKNLPSPSRTSRNRTVFVARARLPQIQTGSGCFVGVAPSRRMTSIFKGKTAFR